MWLDIRRVLGVHPWPNEWYSIKVGYELLKNDNDAEKKIWMQIMPSDQRNKQCMS